MYLSVYACTHCMCVCVRAHAYVCTVCVCVCVCVHVKHKSVNLFGRLNIILLYTGRRADEEDRERRGTI